jgi:hypothetical protein
VARFEHVELIARAAEFVIDFERVVLDAQMRIASETGANFFQETFIF